MAEAVKKHTSVTQVQEMGTIQLSTQDVPHIAEWEDGQMYSITMEVRQIAKTQDGAEFEIINIYATDKKEEEEGYERNANGPYVKVDGISPSVS